MSDYRSDLKNKIIVIVGADSFYGKKIVELLAVADATLILIDFKGEANQSLVCGDQKPSSKQVNHIYYQIDQTEKNLQTLAEQIVQQWGIPDFLFNCCMATPVSMSTHELTAQKLQSSLDHSFFPLFYSVRVFVPLMMASQKPTHMINIACAHEFYALPYQAMSAMSNQSIVVWSECLYHDLKAYESNLTVSLLCLGEEPDLSKAQLQTVFVAVQQQTFYILLNKKIKPLLQQRMQAILQGNKPAVFCDDPI